MKPKLILLVSLVAITMMISCTKNPSNPEDFNFNSDMSRIIFKEGFEGDLSKWEKDVMETYDDFYSNMRISNEAAHNGTYSATTDSNRTALLYSIKPEIDSGICGVQFYIMTKVKGGINFTLELVQKAGSYGGLGNKRFGIGFHVNDSIKTTNYDNYFGVKDKMVSAIEPNHWYKCKIEIDFNTKKVTYFIDDNKIEEGMLPTIEMYCIDRMLIFRGIAAGPDGDIPCSPGSKQYYIDDIVLYTK